MAKGGMEMMRQHKGMAMTGRAPGEGDNFGAESLHDANRRVDHMDAGGSVDSKEMGDSMRSAPPPIRHARNKHPATAHSDHGPHMQGRGQRPGR